MEAFPLVLSLIGFLVVSILVQAGILSWAVGAVSNKPMGIGQALICILVGWPCAQGGTFALQYLLLSMSPTAGPIASALSIPANLMIWGAVISAVGRVPFGHAAMSAVVMSIANFVAGLMLIFLGVMTLAALG